MVLTNDIDCQNCQAEQKIDRGCLQDSPVPGRWEVEGEKYQRCPIKIVTPGSWELIRAYASYKDGFLPNGKGWLDESRKFLDAMNIIEKHSKKDVNHGRK